MCELLALSAAYPTDAQLSLNTFFQHGGQTGPHKDGWGFGCYQQGDAWLFRDPDSAAASMWAPLVQLRAPRSDMIMAHIRLATQGDITLANTQPFTARSLDKRLLFAHNGHVPDFRPASEEVAFLPLGTSDSERVFAALTKAYESSVQMQESERFLFLETFLTAIAQHGPLNILLSDGDTLYAFSNKRTQPDKTVQAPGMHFLERHCAPGGNRDTAVADQHQSVVLFTSVPLSDEKWRPMQPEKLYVARAGQMIHQPVDAPRPRVPAIPS